MSAWAILFLLVVAFAFGGVFGIIFGIDEGWSSGYGAGIRESLRLDRFGGMRGSTPEEIEAYTTMLERMSERLVTESEVADLRAENNKLREERDHWKVEQTHAYSNWEDAYKCVTKLEVENAKLRDALKALMVGTYAELCSDRDAPQCRKCSMGRDECECAITEAMELLGLNTDGTPVGAEVDG